MDNAETFTVHCTICGVTYESELAFSHEAAIAVLETTARYHRADCPHAEVNS